MSQGTELEQTLQMPNVLLAEAGIAERVHDLGGRVVDWAQASWESARRYVPRFALAGLAVAGTAEAVPADASTTYHHRSTMTTQTVLNRIHDALPSGDFVNPGVTQDRVKPTSASLRSSSGTFRTDCKDGKVSTYRYYYISESGTKSDVCDGLYQRNRTASPGEFQRSLNAIGTGMERAVSLSYTQKVLSVGGDRSSVNATYACPPTGHNGAKTIVLQREYTPPHSQYTEATITKC